MKKVLAPERRIAGVIFPALDRLSREPIHIGIFEFELDHFGVKYHYADAPNGSDPMSQMVRQNLAHAAKFLKLANRKNNRGGNIRRVLKGLAPAHRAGTALGIKVYPSWDLRPMRVLCQLDLGQVHSDNRTDSMEATEIQADRERKLATGC